MAATQYAELEIEMERQDAQRVAVELRFSLPDGEERRETGENLCIGFEELRQLAGDPKRYGRRLGQDVFAFPGFSETLAVVRTRAVDLRLRLVIPPHDKDLQGLRWETLTDPDPTQSGAPLLTSERILFSRYVTSRDWRHVPPRAKGDLRALVVVANPSGLDPSRMAPIAVAEEVRRAREGMVGINKVEVLGETDRATKANIFRHLATGPDILYLVCHGALIDDRPTLWLEDDEGKAVQLDGASVVEQLSALKQPPRLVVLVSCQSAGTGAGDAAAPSVPDADALGALGPRLGASGAPAVLAMHGNVTMATIATFMPAFFQELQKDGLVDRAVALARGAVRERPDAWMPVLYMRLKEGNLWSQSGFGSTVAGEPYEGWPALINNIDAGRCTPILGAGMTESLIGPRREIARRWARSFRFPMAEHSQEDLPQVAQFVYVNHWDRMLVLDKLGDSVREGLLAHLGADIPPELSDAAIDALLLELGKRRWETNSDEPHWVLAHAPIPVYITTELDGLMTAALKAAGKEPREELFRWNDDEGWPPLLAETEPGYKPTPEQPLVYHLFGRLGVDHSLVITEDDYFDYLMGAGKQRDLIPDYVRACLAEKSLLFLGFEMEGWDFRVLFRGIQPFMRRGQRLRLAHSGVQVDLNEGRILEIDRARRYLKKYFEDANIHIYWGSVEDFSRELRRQREAA